MRLSLADVARVTGGSLHGAAPETETTGVSIDSRQVGSGHLFVALAGESADGHDFARAAVSAGAAAALVARPVPDAGPQVVVADPLLALQQLAAWVRDVVDPLVVGITGSTGKTSTKDLLHAVSAVRHPTVAAERSFNNDLGVALTLLRSGPDTRVVVCELGARGIGQIRALCRYVRPQVGVVTNVGVTHFEHFGSVEAIVAAKSELPAALGPHGVAVLNADDPRVAGMAAAGPAEVLTYGLARRAFLRADAIEVDRLGRPSFRLVRGSMQVPVQLQMAGRHQVWNALAAAGAGLALGLELEEVALGLAAARSSPWRMEVSQRDGVVVVNDAYNANPTSVAAALQTCAAMVPPGGRLLAVLGGMAELGPIEVAEHRRMGGLAAPLVQRLVTVGDQAAPMAQGARAAGLADVVPVPDTALGGGSLSAVLAALGPLVRGDVVLVKASRVAGLERLAARLVAPLAGVPGAAGDGDPR